MNSVRVIIAINKWNKDNPVWDTRDNDDDDSMSSGGNRKMRGTKAGWEEAGAEFYQESFPAGSDWDQRDPVAIATLLPSKQNRFGKRKKRELVTERHDNNVCWSNFRGS